MACPYCGCKEVNQYDDGWDHGTPSDERAMRCAACGEIFDLEDSADEEDDADFYVQTSAVPPGGGAP